MIPTGVVIEAELSSSDSSTGQCPNALAPAGTVPTTFGMLRLTELTFATNLLSSLRNMMMLVTALFEPTRTVPAASGGTGVSATAPKRQ